MQSQFLSHSFTFDEANKHKLKIPLAELLVKRSEMSYSEVKKLFEMHCTFNLCTEEKLLQPAEAQDEVLAL
jgi:hypothetical protein